MRTIDPPTQRPRGLTRGLLGRILALGLGGLVSLNLFGQIHRAAVPSPDSCSVIGDSIAVGVAQKLPQCLANAQVGLNTAQALMRFWNLPVTDLTIISLGVNDRGARWSTRGKRRPTRFNLTRYNLSLLRNRLRSPHVVWIVPNDPGRRADVLDVAAAHHDRIVDLREPDLLRRLSPTDHIHPDGVGYALLAAKAMKEDR